MHFFNTEMYFFNIKIRILHICQIFFVFILQYQQKNPRFYAKKPYLVTKKFTLGASLQ